MTLSSPFSEREHWCSKRARPGGRVEAAAQPGMCYGAQRRTHMWHPQPPGNSVFCPLGVRSCFSSYPNPTGTSLLPPLIFIFPSLTFQSRFDLCLSCLLLSLLLKSISRISVITFLLADSSPVSPAHTPVHAPYPRSTPKAFQILNTTLPFSGYFFQDLFALCLDFKGLNLLCHFILFLFQNPLPMSSWVFFLNMSFLTSLSYQKIFHCPLTPAEHVQIPTEQSVFWCQAILYPLLLRSRTPGRQTISPTHLSASVCCLCPPDNSLLDSSPPSWYSKSRYHVWSWGSDSHS